MLLALIVRDLRKIVDSRIMVAEINVDKSEQKEVEVNLNKEYTYKWASKNCVQ